ncbi:MAG: hypothetical protein WA446_10655 [Steroidobacteraceae bacterium]
MDKDGVLEYLRDRLATSERSREQMAKGVLKTSTNGQDDTHEIMVRLEREIEELPQLIEWIAGH